MRHTPGDEEKGAGLGYLLRTVDPNGQSARQHIERLLLTGMKMQRCRVTPQLLLDKGIGAAGGFAIRLGRIRRTQRRDCRALAGTYQMKHHALQPAGRPNCAGVGPTSAPGDASNGW